VIGVGENAAAGIHVKIIEVINYSKYNYKITLLNGWVRSSLYFIPLIGAIRHRKRPQKHSHIGSYCITLILGTQ
jgi:hypothetical protein